MPRLNVFDLFRESDAEFVARTDWRYTAQAPVYVTDASVVIQEPLAGAPQWSTCFQEFWIIIRKQF